MQAEPPARPKTQPVVLTLHWNALRVGHRVLVHVPQAVDGRLSPAVVCTVGAHRRPHVVGLRLDADGRVLWPSRLTVHTDPPERERCWRCSLGIRDTRESRE